MAATSLTTPKHGELLRFATAGSVDDGKSTLIGRLLYDTKSIFEDQLEQVTEASKRRHGHNGAVDLSMLTDGLRAEREQGITIDVAYRYFATPRRTFIIADTPGHELYTRNMVTGASTADLALVLVDARNGVVRQSRRHTFVSALLRIPHVVVAVNKMDLVDWSEARFEEIVEEFTAFAAKLEVPDVTFIPVSALLGDNVVERSANMPWYDGSPLLRHLERVHIASDRNLIDPRFPVQWVVRPGTDDHHDYRAYAGQVASGILRPGDEVVVLPSGATSTIAAIDTFGGEVTEAYPPMSVAIRLADDLDISRGDVLARPNNRGDVGREIDAVICWMHEEPATEGKRYVIKHTTRTTRAVLAEVVHRIDVDTLHHEGAISELGLNEIGRARFRTAEPLVYDPYRRNRVTGSFIVIDEATNETVGAGMIIRRDGEGGHGIPVGDQARISENVVRQPSKVDRDERWRLLETRGATVWLTGLPASGKSTVADGVESRLLTEGVNAYRLDGDNLRHGINGNLGFSAEDRAENVRRTAHVARYLADSGTVALVSVVSPYAVDREAARKIHEDIGLDFIEVFVDTPLEECERRDPKGLYAKARAGEISGLTGIDDPYESPTSPELTITPDDADGAVEAVLALLRERGVLT
ncbi:MAG: cysNC [Solirubrobacteraceae bacterium]|nr:cysNC [Solirubrobacteraceae bacterium]